MARVPIGLAVKNSAPHPDISSAEAFKRTLLDARSIAYVDPASGGTSGVFLAQALQKLGITAELKSKIRLVSPAANPQTLGPSVIKTWLANKWARDCHRMAETPLLAARGAARGGRVEPGPA